MSRIPLLHRRGTPRSLVALGLLALAVTFAGSTGATAHGAATAAELNFFYLTGTSVQLKVGTAVVSSGGQVPAGSYNVNVYDPVGANASPKFVFNGPGVSLSTDLNSTGMGIDNTATFGPYTLAANATYTIGDSAVGTISFTTTAATSSGSSGTTTTGSSGSTSGSSSGSSGSTSGSSGSTSGGTTTLALSGAISSAGKASLMLSGRTPTSVKPGTYKVTVLDRSTKAGLVLGTASRTVSISGVAATGTSSKSVALTAGKWYFRSSPTGAKTWFTVG